MTRSDYFSPPYSTARLDLPPQKEIREDDRLMLTRRQFHRLGLELRQLQDRDPGRFVHCSIVYRIAV